jgi:hypothetical protein
VGITFFGEVTGDIVVPDLDQRGREGIIVSDETLVDLKDIHTTIPAGLCRPVIEQ